MRTNHFLTQMQVCSNGTMDDVKHTACQKKTKTETYRAAEGCTRPAHPNAPQGNRRLCVYVGSQGNTGQPSAVYLRGLAVGYLGQPWAVTSAQHLPQLKGKEMKIS